MNMHVLQNKANPLPQNCLTTACLPLMSSSSGSPHSTADVLGRVLEGGGGMGEGVRRMTLHQGGQLCETFECFINCVGQSHKTVSVNDNVLEKQYKALENEHTPH